MKSIDKLVVSCHRALNNLQKCCTYTHTETLTLYPSLKRQRYSHGTLPMHIHETTEYADNKTKKLQINVTCNICVWQRPRQASSTVYKTQCCNKRRIKSYLFFKYYFSAETCYHSGSSQVTRMHTEIKLLQWQLLKESCFHAIDI
jgi:hypothetical protein